MKYLVIGLGNLGRAIAENLSRIGNEVIGIDKDMNRIDTIKQKISGAVCMDSTDREALRTLPLSEIDAFIITFGKDFGTSVQTVALLKSLDVDKLIVRAISPIHETVIRTIGVDEIITPEKDFSAIYATKSMLGGLFRQWYKVTDTHHIYKIKVPSTLVGQQLGTINLKENFHVRLIAIERACEVRNLIGVKQTEYKVIEELPNELFLESQDRLIIFGKKEDLNKLASI